MKSTNVDELRTFYGSSEDFRPELRKFFTPSQELEEDGEDDEVH